MFSELRENEVAIKTIMVKRVIRFIYEKMSCVFWFIKGMKYFWVEQQMRKIFRNDLYFCLLSSV